MSQLVSKPQYGQEIGKTEKGQIVYASEELQNYLDELQNTINALLLGDAVVLPRYTVLTVPPAADWRGSLIYVTDETGGEVLAFSDGSDWRRCTDRNIIS